MNYDIVQTVQNLLKEHPDLTDGHLFRGLLAIISELEETIADAKSHNSYMASPCPLCTYDNGKFIRSCVPHQELTEQYDENDRLRKELAALKDEVSTLRAAALGPAQANTKIRC